MSPEPPPRRAQSRLSREVSVVSARYRPRYEPNPYAIPASRAVNQYAAIPSMHVGWDILQTINASRPK